MKLNRIQVRAGLVLALLVLFSGPGPLLAQKQPTPLLVVISIDGLRPDYITAADQHGAKVPVLRRFMKEGTYADGVAGVLPTVTYPSHTTLMTGVWPAKHGILANAVFDPLSKNYQGWYWYAEDIHAPTLWDAAAAAGRTTASIQWPVTVGAKITWDIPEFWRAGTPDDAKLLRAVSTPGLLAEGKAALGTEYRGGIDTSVEGDEVRGKYAVWILESKHPGLLTLHLTALDHTEHETQPFSPESIAVLERLDEVVGKVRAAAEHLSPGHAFVAVVSDHGFVSYDHQLNLFPAFREAKLFSVDDKGVTDWRAMPWVTGGSAAIVLKDSKDEATLVEVRSLLNKLAGDPANGIDRILEADELHKRGGYPNASFFVSLKPGWRTGSALAGPVVSSTTPGGTHGELPDLPDLRAAFFLVGPGVPAGKDLGLIDMRDIASTLAKEAGLNLPSADGNALLP